METITKCKMAHLTPGEKCKLTWWPGTKCLACGNELPVVTVDAIYQGHTVDGDTFDQFTIKTDFRCPSCQERVVTYRQKCEAGGAFPAEVIKRRVRPLAFIRRRR